MPDDLVAVLHAPRQFAPDQLHREAELIISDVVASEKGLNLADRRLEYCTTAETAMLVFENHLVEGDLARHSFCFVSPEFMGVPRCKGRESGAAVHLILLIVPLREDGVYHIYSSGSTPEHLLYN
jgi:hypothetical protein